MFPFLSQQKAHAPPPLRPAAFRVRDINCYPQARAYGGVPRSPAPKSSVGPGFFPGLANRDRDLQA